MILGTTPDDREHALAELYEASEALERGEYEAALFALVRAIACDPLFDVPRGLLVELAPHVLHPAAAAAA